VRLEGGVRADRRAVGVALRLDARDDETRVGGLGEHDLNVGARGLDRLSRAVEGAARPVARHPVVELLALEIVEDFGAGGHLVELPISLVLELVAQEPPVLLAQLLRLAHHACALPCLGRHNHLRAEHAHELAALDREGLGHANDAVVAALRAHHRDGDARVAGGGLDDRVPLLQLAALLGLLDDGESEAVLDRGEWVEVLALGVQIHALWAHLV